MNEVNMKLIDRDEAVYMKISKKSKTWLSLLCVGEEGFAYIEHLVLIESIIMSSYLRCGCTQATLIILVMTILLSMGDMQTSMGWYADRHRNVERLTKNVEYAKELGYTSLIAVIECPTYAIHHIYMYVCCNNKWNVNYSSWYSYVIESRRLILM